MDPVAKLVGLVAAVAIGWLLSVLAVRKARRRLAAADQAKAHGEPFRTDIGAYVVFPGKVLGRASYGHIHIQPGSVIWQSRFQRHTQDLTGRARSSRRQPRRQT